MKKQARAIDGFVPRRRNGAKVRLDEIGDGVRPPDEMTSVTDPRKMDFFQRKKTKTAPAPADDELSGDISQSLLELPGYDNLASDDFAETDQPADKKAMKKALKKAKKSQAKKPKGKKKKVIIAIVVILALALLGAAWYLWSMFNKPFDNDNPFSVFWQEKLVEDENGRSNILIFGTAPDDYDGPLLADTILVLSVNQNDKTAYMISLPRDLWVKHECPDQTLNTTAGKLNETYRCMYNTDRDNEEEASDAFREKVGEVLGLDVQYYAHMGWAAVTQIVDDMGGIDVTIESDDPRGIYDYNTGIKFAQGELAHLDGTTALNLARARGAGGGYGLDGSNFAREKNQQIIIKAIQQKMLSSGLLSNPGTLISLIGTLGNNLHTNFKTSEINVLIDLGREIKSDSIVSLPLLDPDNGVNLVKTGSVGAASVVMPSAGLFDYSEIHAYIKSKTSSNPVVREAAVIDVLNGSTTPGLAQQKADELEQKGYNIGTVGNAPTGTYAKVEIYQAGADKLATAAALGSLFGVELKNVIPAGINTAGADFVIIIGAATD
ncbi:MAG: LCP family protein [Candidatus Nomurabacteria bacterium]|jgi:LCP family protein required for cell wall assembly|nr:LCP family protein [Candidatus Nomurabacteria bacterium]